jgi:hypothetical protein
MRLTIRPERPSGPYFIEIPLVGSSFSVHFRGMKVLIEYCGA